MERKVEIFTRVYDRYALIKSIAEDLPVTDIALNPDGDVLAVSKLFGKELSIYSLNCNGDLVKEKDFSGASAVEITNYELILAECSGNVRVYSYSFLASSCDAFGEKEVVEIKDVNTVQDANRAITSVKVSGNQMLASSKYSGLFLFEKGAEGFSLSKHLGGNIFISNVDIVSSLNTFVAASYNRSVLVYKDEGEGYDLSETIQTESQALHVDLSEDKKVLVGMMNGDLALFTPGS
jgi:WD40 repeat protein